MMELRWAVDAQDNGSLATTHTTNSSLCGLQLKLHFHPAKRGLQSLKNTSLLSGWEFNLSAFRGTLPQVGNHYRNNKGGRIMEPVTKTLSRWKRGRLANHRLPPHTLGDSVSNHSSGCWVCTTWPLTPHTPPLEPRWTQPEAGRRRGVYHQERSEKGTAGARSQSRAKLQRTRSREALSEHRQRGCGGDSKTGSHSLRGSARTQERLRELSGSRAM